MAAHLITAQFSSTADATPAYVLPSSDTVYIAQGVLGFATGVGSATVSGGLGSSVVNAGQLFSASDAAIGFTSLGCSVVLTAGASATGKYGVQFFGGSNSLTNNGAIYGDLAGVGRLSTVAGTIGDTIVNHGTIGGGFGAINYLDVDGKNDTVVNTGTLDGLVKLGAGDDRFDSSAGTLTDQVRGGPGNDTIAGSAFADSLWGDADDDSLQGQGGDDVLTGGAGADELAGGAGQDIANYFGARAVHASLTNPASNTGDAAGDSYSSIEGLWGGDADDILTGNNGANLLNGRLGADRMTGLGGNDVYWVDDAADRVIEASGGGRDTVYSTVSFSLAGTFCESLALRGGGNINGTGSSGDDTIYGNWQANRIDGGNGNDLLYGGKGADKFRFDTPLNAGKNVDHVGDYVVADDTIELDRAIFTAVGPSGPLAASMFHIGSGAHDASDRIIYNAATGNLFYDSDGTGSHAAVLFAVLAPDLALTEVDFMLRA